MTQQLPEGTTSRGNEAAQEILRAQRDLVRQQVEEHSGHEVKGLGDGFMVAFASARKAVACAVEIPRAGRAQPPAIAASPAAAPAGELGR